LPLREHAYRSKREAANVRESAFDRDGRKEDVPDDLLVLECDERDDGLAIRAKQID
jgi:hypothetical protein